MRKKIDLWENVISEDAFSNAFHINLSGKSYVALKSVNSFLLPSVHGNSFIFVRWTESPKLRTNFCYLA